MSKAKYVVRCQACGCLSPRWMGRCPECGEWNTMVEEPLEATLSKEISPPTSPQPISQILETSEKRFPTNIRELDCVLGGGLVPGAMILVGGEPGIGKSTLLLQVANNLAETKGPVLLVSGEESVEQTRMRGERLRALSQNLYLVSETNLEFIETHIENIKPCLLVIDSIQTVFHPEMPAPPGSIGQVRESTARLMQIAKSKNLATFISGHVTKEGAIAGPRVLEHMVDTVLYFEGERYQSYRIIRAVKNRFGSTNEIGVFEMKASGLEEVTNPSALFLAERASGVAGSVVAVTMEGTRPFLVELQALVMPSYLSVPRRLASGLDYNKFSLTLAVLERRVGLRLERQDVYVSVAGGIKVQEPAVDLAVALAVVSAYKNKEIPPDLAVFGEVGLAGELRFVGQAERRIAEAAKLGFKQVIMPAQGPVGRQVKGVEIFSVKTLEAALKNFQ